MQASTTGDNWEDIDVRNDIAFNNNGETFVFETPYTSVNELKSYKFFRLLISENGGGESLSLGEWQLFGSPQSFTPSFTANGGTITGQYEGYTNAKIENLIDGEINTKYEVRTSARGWMQYASNQSAVVDRYSITPAFGSFERNLKDWQLRGSKDGKKWEILDERKDVDFIAKFNTLEFEVASPGDYSHYRLIIFQNNGATSFQLTEWHLYEKDVSSINNVSQDDEIAVFPNPVVDKFSIETSQEISSVDIVNIRGSIVKSFYNKQTIYDISDLPAGNYFVIIRSESQTYSRSLIKQ